MRSLFEFESSEDVSAWNVVNDGVMGGRSTSQVGWNEEGSLLFQGNLSLENNGGFASFRSKPRELGLIAAGTIVLRVKGDGRTYTFNLYSPDRRTAFSFQRDFETVASEWKEVRLPINEFVAHSFGRRMDGERLEASQINSVGILLGDKRSGSFELATDWIRVE